MHRETIAALLPLRSLHNGKRRLSGVLAVDERTALVQQLFMYTYQALVSSKAVNIVCVISPDPSILAWVVQFDLLALQQPDQGLNAGLEYARDVLLQCYQCASLLVVLPDLPLINDADIAAMVELSNERTVVLAPDRHGRGTNALLVRPARALPFCFGDDSLPLHTEAARARGLACKLYYAPGTALDLDTSDDLRYMQQLSEPRIENKEQRTENRPTTNDQRRRRVPH
jgi:2-phospho-L-lactate guanylyltransferase